MKHKTFCITNPSSKRKLIIITGHSRGLGREIALSCIKRGDVVCGLSRTRANFISNLTPDQRAHFVEYKFDLAKVSESSFSAILTKLLRIYRFYNWESVEFIFCAAEIGKIGAIGYQQNKDIQKYYKTHLSSTHVILNDFESKFRNINCTKKIICISSSAAVKPLRGCSLYCTTKAGFEMLFNLYALEQLSAKFPANVYIIRPGLIDTDMQKQLRASNSKDLPDRSLFRNYLKLGYIRSASDVAMLILRRCAARPQIGNVRLINLSPKRPIENN